MDSAFLVLAKAPRHHIFPRYTNIEESLLYSLMFKEGAAKIANMLHQDGLMRNTEVFLSSGKFGDKIGGKLVGRSGWVRLIDAMAKTQFGLSLRMSTWRSCCL